MNTAVAILNEDNAADEQKQLVETARKFTREKIIPVAQKLDEHGTFPQEICEQGWELGLMNGEVPQEYGGLGLSMYEEARVVKARRKHPTAVSIADAPPIGLELAEDPD